MKDAKKEMAMTINAPRIMTDEHVMATSRDGKITKRNMIKALEKALIASGHTPAYAKAQAKVHYKKYLGQARKGW